MYRTDFWTLWEKARVWCSERTALKQVYYQGWKRSPTQVGCKRQVLWAGALGRHRGIRWRGRWEGGLGWGIHVNPWLIHVNVWQKPLQYCNVISLQLIKINRKKIKKKKKKRQRNQRSNCQYPLDHRKSKRVQKKHLFLLYWLCQSLWLCGSPQLENS